MQIDRINELWALTNASGETYTKHEPYLYLTEKQAQQAADELAETARMHSKPSRRLNPLFVEWLMGWPIGWTGYEPVGTVYPLYRQQLQHSYCSIVPALAGSVKGGGVDATRKDQPHD